MIKLDTCTNCGVRVIPSRMADHWMIAKHYSANLPARSVRFLLDTPADAARFADAVEMEIARQRAV